MHPTHSMKRLTVLIPALLAAGAAGPACRSAARDPLAPAAAHAVESEQLERIMAQLERLDGALLPQELDVEDLRQRRRGELSELAGALARSAQAIPTALEDGVLPAEERAEFAELAQDLEVRARELERAALESDQGAFEARVTAVRASCSACHSRFRVLPPLR